MKFELTWRMIALVALVVLPLAFLMYAEKIPPNAVDKIVTAITTMAEMTFAAIVALIVPKGKDSGKPDGSGGATKPAAPGSFEPSADTPAESPFAKRALMMVATAIAIFVAGCFLRAPIANAVVDLAFAECVARAPDEADARLCAQGRDIADEVLRRILAAKRVGMQRAAARREGLPDPWDGGAPPTHAGDAGDAAGARP